MSQDELLDDFSSLQSVPCSGNTGVFAAMLEGALKHAY